MHIELSFQNITEAYREIIIAKLYMYCEGFEEQASGLIAIIAEKNYTQDVKDIIAGLEIAPGVNTILPQNWNHVWESNFEPVVVDDFVAVRADFHEPVSNVMHEIIITPKMSFGTGHHATTYLMMQMMKNMDFHNKSVFDFGTGTGILSILAKKLGAQSVTAIDIDEWSIENAGENFLKNSTDDIYLLQSDAPPIAASYNIILANINKNVLMATIPKLAALLNKDGAMLLSGLLTEDEVDIIRLCTNNSLIHTDKALKNGWIALQFNKL